MVESEYRAAGYNSRIMLKSISIAALLIVACAVFVAIQDERSAEQHEQNAANGKSAFAAAKTGEDQSDPRRNSPRWFGIFRWPDGITTWAIILTLATIAIQTRETARSARSSEVAVLAALNKVTSPMSGEPKFSTKVGPRKQTDCISTFTAWSDIAMPSILCVKLISDTP